jgi:undecaprenyl-phosphate 4-deoxy-4-formamido-L-arabinose transferase
MLKNLGSRFSNWVADFIVDKPKGLYLSSFKCLSRFTVQEIIKYKGPYPYIDGLALRCTRDIGKIEARHVPRREGRSGYTFRRLVGLWLNMFINFSVIPLRLSTFVGLGFSFLGMSLSIFVLIDKFYHPDIPMGWPSLIVAVMVFSGVQLVVLGLVGEYVGRLFLSSNQTPQFVIREIIKVK